MEEMASAKLFAAQFLSRVIGPDADLMAVKVDECMTPAELAQLMEKYREVVRSVGGSSRAEEFASGTMAHLP